MTEDASASDEVRGIARKSSPDGEIVATTPYSMSPRSQKRWITFIVGVAMMFSPLSANIYLPSFPLLPTRSAHQPAADQSHGRRICHPPRDRTYILWRITQQG